jgi:uncharacterized membrane protein YdbT with pleckstrin-like domain
MATYVDRVLEPGESVRYRTTVSWIVYIPSVVLAAIALAALLVGINYPDRDRVFWFVATISALVAMCNFAYAWFRRWTTEIAVTDRRVILKRGLIRRHTVEMNMGKVESVDVDQTVAGRIFNYGDVTIRGTGTTFERLRVVDAPLKLRSTLTAS